MIALAALALVVAAPVPKAGEAQKLKDTFGEIADPMSEVRCELTRAGALRVTVPKEARPTWVNIPTPGMSVTTKTMEGDFVLTVRVSHVPAERAEVAPGEPTLPLLSAGITLYAKDDPTSSVTFTHRYVKSGDKKWVGGQSMYTLHKNRGASSGNGNIAVDGKPVYLRLTRRVDEFISETSSDGKKWTALGKISCDKFGPAVVVGPSVQRNTDMDHTAEFDEYEVKLLKSEVKK